MRISANSDDIGYQAYMQSLADRKTVTVRLDGVEQSVCITADEEAGSLVRCVLDAQGRAQIDPNDKESIWVETVHGKVEVTIS